NEISSARLVEVNGRLLCTPNLRVASHEAAKTYVRRATTSKARRREQLAIAASRRWEQRVAKLPSASNGARRAMADERR
ncbi:hypothetical protein Dimus_037206, partial [Dionaea muscipula]